MQGDPVEFKRIFLAVATLLHDLLPHDSSALSQAASSQLLGSDRMTMSQ